jgi:hypothetical protein
VDRRLFVLGAGAAAVSSRLYAAQTNIGAMQRAFVERPIVVRQECPLWCWAASASMIFAAHGHPVDQMKIVARVFGALECRGAGDALTIVQILNSPWIDDSGQQFQPRITAAYDPMNGVNDITNTFIINELINNRPVLYCNTHHAMVIVDFDYVMGPAGPTPQSVGVLDPFPTSQAYHPLTLPELFGITMAPGGQMTFLAAVEV